jgi:hypothetical protein
MMTLAIGDRGSDRNLEEMNIEKAADLEAHLATVPGEVRHNPYLVKEHHFLLCF